MEWIPDWLVDFQTSKLVGFIGAGDTLERFGLQESNCSHIFLKRKMMQDGFVLICCGGRCRKGGRQEDQAVHGPKLKYRFGIIWSLLNGTQNRTGW